MRTEMLYALAKSWREVEPEARLFVRQEFPELAHAIEELTIVASQLA